MSNIDVFEQLDSFDLGTVETRLPFLPNGVYPAKIVAVTVADQKPPKTGKNLRIRVALTQPAEDINGKPVQAGFPLFDTISLSKSIDEVSGEVKYDPFPALARFREAVMGSKEGTFLPVEQYAEQECRISVTYAEQNIDKNTQEDYGPQNRIKAYLKA